MDPIILDAANTDYLDEALLCGPWDEGEEGRLKLLSYQDYAKFNRNHILVWCLKNSRYNLPTKELVEWLKEIIGGRHAIEIGAGMADLSYWLGITATDSYMQQRPEIKAYYELLNQPITTPPENVLKLEASEAVAQLKPQVVVASWVTQIVSDEECQKNPQIQGSMYGANEEDIIANCECYIHIGNEAAHAEKRVLSLPHKEYKFPWIVSRGRSPERNVIYVWGK